MATFGEMINLQPYILNWIVNGDNSDKAFRELVNETTHSGNIKKSTYRGNYIEFFKNYLIPTSKVSDIFSDRKPADTSINKGKILKSLIEYKKRWNINGDSSTLKITYIGFSGSYLIVKTEERMQRIELVSKLEYINYLRFEDITYSFATTGSNTIEISYDTFITEDSPTNSSVIFSLGIANQSIVGVSGDPINFMYLRSSVGTISNNPYININSTVFNNNQVALSIAPATTQYVEYGNWYNVRVIIDDSNAGSLTNSSIYLNNVDISGSPTINIPMDDTAYSAIVVSGTNPFALYSADVNSFGYVKNLKLTINGTDIIDCPVPYTLVNNAGEDAILYNNNTVPYEFIEIGY